MEMGSSRRSAADRPAPPGPKKPRPSDEIAERDRGSNGSVRTFAPRDPRAGGGMQMSARLRSVEREEKGVLGRGGGLYQQDQELVVQYRAALAELTFNSKPVITNLTIIAGENLHAAKKIAATLCNHILEVSSEQKLPSLYLLDSIVKNIKGDYIRYFAARLPEVFVKAYRQVEPSIHSGMRHLFGTWKTVFPSGTLQIIEKELNFASVINGSSGSTALKPELPITQNQPHSIHVNPKYLEARQRLQQLSRAKDTSSEDSSGADETEKYERAAIVGNTKRWMEPSSKMHNIQRPQREQLTDPVHEKRYRDVRDHELSPEISRQPLELGVGKVINKVKQRDAFGKTHHGPTGDDSEMASGRRNDFDASQAYGTYRPSGFIQNDYPLSSVHQTNTNKSVRSILESWKNSEEEEFMWDDMNSRSTSEGTNNTVKVGWNNDGVDKPASLQRGEWISEHQDSSWNNFDSYSQFRKIPEEENTDPLFKDLERHLPQTRAQQDPGLRTKLEAAADPFSHGRSSSGYHASSVWPPKEPPSLVDGLDHISSRISGQSESQPASCGGSFPTRPGPLLQGDPPTGCLTSGTAGFFGQSKKLLRPSSPASQSPPSSVPIRQPHNLTGHVKLQSHSFSQIGQKPMHIPGQSDRLPLVPAMRDSFPSLSQGGSQQSHTKLNSSPAHLQTPSSSASLYQMRCHIPFTQLSEPEVAHQTQASQLSIQMEKPKPPSLVAHPIQGSTTVYPNTDVDTASQSVQMSTSNLLAAIMSGGLLPNNPASSLQSQSVQPPLPSGPPPLQLASSSAPLATSTSSPFTASHVKTPSLVPSVTSAVLPPLPPGPPPATSQITTTSQFSSAAVSIPDPLRCLLSSLLSKRIISSPAAVLPTITSPQTPNESSNKNNPVSSLSALVPTASTSLTIPPSSPKELNISEPSASRSKTEDNLIGFDFKPEIIREFHRWVISSLYDDLSYQCNICGLRFRLPEQLSNHIDWHALRKSEASIFERVSRNWYADKSDWTVGNVGPSCGPTAASLEELDPGQEKCEDPMLPADENQSICALCGDLFEDFYSEERDDWMYRGTVYLSSAFRQVDIEDKEESMGLGLIVHAKCVPGSVDNTRAWHTADIA